MIAKGSYWPAKNFGRRWGVIHQGVIHENFLNAYLYTKGCPWLHKGENRRFKKNHFAFVKNCGYTPGGYNKGVIHKALIIAVSGQLHKIGDRQH